MKKNYINLRNYLENRFPELVGRVRGENYPPPPLMQALATAVQTMQTFSMVFAFFGGRMFEAIGMPIPPWYEWVKDNKLRVFGTLFVINMFVQQAAMTGAFEITFNGQPVYSKLETGKMPAVPEIIVGLKRAGLIIEA